MPPAVDDARWCPWCASVLPASTSETKAGTAADEQRCPSCNGNVPAGAALTARPGAPLHPADPEAQAPAKGPLGSTPLPAGTPDPTIGGMAVWAASIAAAIVLLSVAAYFVGGPALDRVPPPTPKPTPVRTVATPTPTPSPTAR